MVEEPKVKLQELRQQQQFNNNENELEDINNNHTKDYDKDKSMSLSNNSLDDSEPSDEESNIIPWRAQLRKTNSSLNLMC